MPPKKWSWPSAVLLRGGREGWKRNCASASYAIEKRISRSPESFGQGAIEGVAGPEAANNAAAQGAFIPLLTLGIPGNAVMALTLGALKIHGLIPGPLMIKDHPNGFRGVVASMYIGNFLPLILNLPLIGIWVRLLRVSTSIRYPMIIFLHHRSFQRKQQPFIRGSEKAKGRGEWRRFYDRLLRRGF
jgi:TctA family transporter